MQNLFIGKGNLADSPELKRINGKNGEFAVASMRVMFGRYGQNEEGDVEQIGGFWREVEIYGQKAEACAKLLRKGARVLVPSCSRKVEPGMDVLTDSERVRHSRP